LQESAGVARKNVNKGKREIFEAVENQRCIAFTTVLQAAHRPEERYFPDRGAIFLYVYSHYSPHK
jgi:hypothetical protein